MKWQMWKDCEELNVKPSFHVAAEMRQKISLLCTAKVACVVI